MTRSEHLQWCKDRALAYVDDKNLNEAFASFSSDMSKHSETKNHMALELGAMMFFGRQLDTPEKMRKWINDFN